MRRFFTCLLVCILVISVTMQGSLSKVNAVSANATSISNAELDAAINSAAEFLLRTVQNPTVGAVGGEWMIIGLARSGFAVPDTLFENYYRVVEQYVRARSGILDARRITEHSRVILSLTSIGFDPRGVAGHNLLLPLGDFESTIWQGINGSIFALLALDSNNYEIPRNESAATQATRELYVAEILRRQTSDGGFNLTAGLTGPVGANEVGDADITGMALQALAKYRNLPNVNAAIDRALTFLSNTQDAQGGFVGSFSAGSSAVESVVQVVVALGELGIPINDPRFVKNGNTLVDNILSFQNADGGFRHSAGAAESNIMSTEQALYGLVSVRRAADGKNSLYNMTDVVRRGEIQTSGNVGLPGKHADVRKIAVAFSGRTFPDVQNHRNRGAVEALAARGIINGRSETEFAPDATMTRAEFSAIITRGLGLPERTGTAFTDVPENAWFANAVATAFYYEIIQGLNATTFNPNGTITRQEAGVMIARAARLVGFNTGMNETQVRNLLAPFGDHRTVATWAQEALAFNLQEGIMDDQEFYLNPTEAISRAEIAEMLYRLLKRGNLI